MFVGQSSFILETLNRTITLISKLLWQQVCLTSYIITWFIFLLFKFIRTAQATSSRSLGCCRSKTWRITSRIGACQACLHLMFTFTDVCACEIRRREVNEACRCACPDGIAPSKPRGKLVATCFRCTGVSRSCYLLILATPTRHSKGAPCYLYDKRFCRGEGLPLW